jgi:hypothetical protein
VRPPRLLKPTRQTAEVAIAETDETLIEEALLCFGDHDDNLRI